MRRLFTLTSQLMPWLFLALGLVPLLIWAYLGFFTRYLADDYSTAAAVLHRGFWPAQFFWYRAWSGRYSFTFLASLIELAGVKMLPLLPMVALTAWFLSLYWALKQIFAALALPVEKKWLGILTAAILFGVVKSLPGYTEVLFWQAGILTYQISNILFAICLALFLKRFFSSSASPKVAAWEYFAAFGIGLITGGFSETWVVMQVALITFSLLYFVFLYKKQNRSDILRILLAAYLASWCAFIIIDKSPGNLARTTRVAGISLQSVAGAMIDSIKDVPLFLTQWVTGYTALVLGLLLTGVVAGFFALRADNDKPASRKHFLLSVSWLALGCVMLSAGFFPAFVVWDIRPVDRAVFLPMFLFVLTFVLFGFFGGRFLSALVKTEKLRLYSQAFLLLSLTLIMLWMQMRVALVSVQLIPTLQTYARLWDERDAFLHEASTQARGNIVLPSLRHHPAMHDIRDTIWIAGELSENKFDWVNRTAAQYYGVKSISGK